MKQNSKFPLVMIFVIFLPLILFFIDRFIIHPQHTVTIEVKVQWKLKNYFTGILTYHDKNEKYPSAENWQDLLLTYFGSDKEPFTLPSKVETKNTIALNPNAKPDSPRDVVVLFESTGGPNAHGQSELLAPTSNGKPGCYVLFNDGLTKFIKPEQVKDLNWGNYKN
jgi:hypothetical protein